MHAIRTAAMLVTSVLATSATAASLDLDFEDGVTAWRVVLDGVMGGRSTGRVTQLESGILRFTGTLSLENNGGFSQIRRPVEEGALADTAGIELRVRGDGRTYQFNLRTSNVQLMAGGYEAAFETTGDWQTVRIPFDRFELTSFGRRVPNPTALRADLIESIGVTLADKRPGPFELSIDGIRGYGLPAPASGAETPPALRTAAARNVMGVLERGIERGVPLFNAGAPQACYAVYDVTVNSILELAPSVLDDETRVDLEQALADASSESDPGAAAWKLRRAMDRAYARLSRDVSSVAFAPGE